MIYYIYGSIKKINTYFCTAKSRTLKVQYLFYQANCNIYLETNALICRGIYDENVIVKINKKKYIRFLKRRVADCLLNYFGDLIIRKNKYFYNYIDVTINNILLK